MPSESCLCRVCKVPSSLKCGRCRKVVYCSREHQTADWKTHKTNCFACKFKVEVNEVLGRHLVAADNIAVGELVLEEEAIFTIPPTALPNGEQNAVCLGCYKILVLCNVFSCSKCGLPICSAACEEAECHKPECQVTRKDWQRKEDAMDVCRYSDLVNSYVALLRYLHVRDTDEKRWEKLSKLEAHADAKKGDPSRNQRIRVVSELIKTHFNFHAFTEDDLWRIFNVTEVNAHSVVLIQREFLSVYDTGSLIEHDCRSNCFKSFSETGKLVIRAAKELRKGDHISICYFNAMLGVHERQAYFRTTKNFCCRCSRCTDPTELGTHFNSVRCQSGGCDGYMAPICVSSDPGNPIVFRWNCSSCKAERDDKDVLNLLRSIEEQGSRVEGIENYHTFLASCGQYLHPNHYLLVQVKGRLQRDFCNLSMSAAGVQVLETIINNCRETSDLATFLAPAEYWLIGVCHYWCGVALLALNNKKSLNAHWSSSQSAAMLLEARKELQKAYDFLKYESAAMPEGAYAVTAAEKIREIDAVRKSWT